MNNIPSPRKAILRVLLVDDEEPVHIQLRSIMHRPPPANVEIVSAMTIEQAYEEIERQKPHVILLDLNLGGTWHWTRTIEEIEALDAAAECPVIAFSGLDADKMWPLSVKQYGAYNFFSKDSALLAPSDKDQFEMFRAKLLNDIANAIFMHGHIHRTPDDAAEAATR